MTFDTGRDLPPGVPLGREAMAEGARLITLCPDTLILEVRRLLGPA